MGETGDRLIYQNLIKHEKIASVNVIRLVFNEINRDQREDLKKQLKDLLDTGGKKFIMDFSKVGFLSSLVVATIISFAKELFSRNGHLKLFSTSNEPLAVLRLTKLDRIFEVYKNENEALESFK
jgi:anti-sigma B factor antagonist